MDQIYVDTLNTVVIHKYDLDALVFELEAVERQNTILYIVLFLVVAAAILIGYKIVGKHKRQLEQEHLQKKLLSKQVENLPYLSESINKISNKSIRISSSLYEELQSLLNDVKSGSKNSQCSVYYIDLVSELEKMGDFMINISQALERAFIK